jgi:HEAT repeat protein
VLDRAASDPAGGVRAAAITQLWKIADTLARLLLLREALADPSDPVRLAAAIAFLKSDVQAVTPVLTALLKCPEKDVRWGAIRELEKIGTVDLAPAMLTLLGEPNSTLRHRVAAILAKSGSDSVKVRLRAALNDESETVQLSAA